MQIWVKKKRCRNSVITEPRRLLLLDSVLHLATSFYKKNWKHNHISIIDEQLCPVFELQNLKLIHKNYFDNQYKCIFFYGKHVSRITNVCNKTANDSVRQAVSFQRCSWHLFASLKLTLPALIMVLAVAIATQATLNSLFTFTYVLRLFILLIQIFDEWLKLR